MMLSPTFELSDGTRVQLVRLFVTGTYHGAYEGTRQSVSQFILRRLHERHEDELGFQIISGLSSDGALPEWQCEVDFESSAFRDLEVNDKSSLRIFFWTDQFEPGTSLTSLLQPVIPHIHWKSNAREWSLDDF